MKDERYIRYTSVYKNDRNFPSISINGRWVEEAGFSTGSDIEVGVEPGKLTITPCDPEKYTPQSSDADLDQRLSESSKPVSYFDGDYHGYLVKLKLERKTDHKPIRLNNSAEVYEFLRPLGEASRETLLSLMLDTVNRVIGTYEVSKGGINYAVAPAQEVIKSAVMMNSASVILAHNHPSGNITPSIQDERLTQRLAKALDYSGIRFLDHIIIGHDSYLSMNEKGYIKQARTDLP